MRSDFAATGKAARDRIPVPELSMESIRSRSHTASVRGRVRALVVSSVMCMALLGAGVGFGGKFYDGVRVWLSGGNSAVVVRSLVMVREPTVSDLHNIMARATFPVVFPVGVPAGTHVNMIIFAPKDRPNAMFIQYRNERANFNVGMSLIDSSVVNTSGDTLANGPDSPPFRAGYHWQIGGETVLVPRAHISAKDMNTIRAAMMNVSAAKSAAVTGTMLRRITVLNDVAGYADIAERSAPFTGHSVLLGTTQVKQISVLSKNGKPVLDTRIVFLDNIPSTHGEPDYARATPSWPKVVVVSAAGVRAIDAVLRSTGARGNCGCEILFNQPSNSVYWVWKISESASAVVIKYSVDTKTFAVSQAPN